MPIGQYADWMRNIVKGCMEKALDLSVPMVVKVKQGKSWGEMEAVN